MVRVGFDAVRALRNSTGLGNYARRVLRSLLVSGSNLRAELYSHRAPLPRYAGLPGELGAGLHLPGGPAGWPGVRNVWRTFRLGRRAARDGIELYHGLTQEIPRDLPRQIPSVVSILDLIWERYPNFYPMVDRRSYRWRYRWSALHADAIVAPSRFTRDELLALYGIDPDRVAVIPPPLDPRFAAPVPPTAARATLTRLQLPDRFLLSVGTLEARKNQEVLIRALARLDPARTPPLVVVGRDRGSGAGLARLALSLGVESRVYLRSRVDDESLLGLIHSAALFLYPSLLEGFGMPIAEALAAGVPVLASDQSWAREAGGPDSRYVPATDPAAWAEALGELLDDAAITARMREAGRHYAERFEPARLAARLREVYEAVVAGRPKLLSSQAP